MSKIVQIIKYLKIHQFYFLRKKRGDIAYSIKSITTITNLSSYYDLKSGNAANQTDVCTGLFCFERIATNENSHKQIRGLLFVEPAGSSRTMYQLHSFKSFICEKFCCVEVVQGVVFLLFSPVIMIYAGRNKFEVSQNN